MAKYTVAFTVVCDNPQEAAQLKAAYQTISNYLPKSDLIWVASQIKANPKVIQKVKSLASNPLVSKLF